MTAGSETADLLSAEEGPMECRVNLSTESCVRGFVLSGEQI